MSFRLKKKMICGWVGKRVSRLIGYFRRGRERVPSKSTTVFVSLM